MPSVDTKPCFLTFFTDYARTETAVIFFVCLDCFLHSLGGIFLNTLPGWIRVNGHSERTSGGWKGRAASGRTQMSEFEKRLQNKSSAKIICFNAELCEWASGSGSTQSVCMKEKQQSTLTTTTSVSATKGPRQSASHLRQCRKRLDTSNNKTGAVTAVALRKRRRAREEFSSAVSD